MSTSTGTRSNDVDRTGDHRRISTETKNSTKTTELLAYVAVVIAVIVTANVYDGGNGDGGDPFNATTAIRYIVYLTIAYMIARGLAKSGSREFHDA